MSNGSLAAILYGKRNIIPSLAELSCPLYFKNWTDETSMSWSNNFKPLELGWNRSSCSNNHSVVCWELHLTFQFLYYKVMVSIENSLWIFLGEEKKLSWDERLQIAIDISHGIEYLHEGVCMFPDTFFYLVCENVFWLTWICIKQAVPPVIHRDLKSPNILLDDSMRAKVKCSLNKFLIAIFLE